jgi:heavy metal sensor kinase
MSSAPVDGPAGGPQRRRWFFMPRTFRGLITAWNTVTILLFTVVILVGLREGVRYAEQREEDKLRSEDATEIGLWVERFAPDWNHVNETLARKAESRVDRKWFCQVHDAGGNVWAESRSAQDVQTPRPEADGPLHQTVGFYRVTQRRTQTAAGDEMTVVVGTSLDEIAEDVARTTQVLLVAAAILLLTAPLGGFWLAGRVIRPLADIIKRTEGLRPRNLEERLPLRQTGDELDQLSATINGFLDRIANYLAHHRELTANVAHELRSPLAAMLSAAEVALNRDRTPDEYKELLGSIVDECVRLGGLVQQLLLLAESDAGRLEAARDRIALDQIVRKAVEVFEGVAESRGIRLDSKVDGPVWVLGDSGQLQQVVFNLVDNAIKFTPSGSVGIEVRKEDDGSALLLVTDTGVGIAPENLPHVFDRFYRGDQARSRMEAGGSGLGLSICQALVTAHRGTIVVTSEVGCGTQVRVLLPGTS